MYFIILFLSFLLFKINADMHCLVARPGFGLISEVCPLHTVGCRIRIEKDAVSFYEYSRLYDRNQFVCVLKGEFGEQKGSGCTRKRSGHIRCWCFGRSNCNTPENSKLLYLTKNLKRLLKVLYEASDIKKAMGAKTVHLSEQFVDNSFTKSSQKLTTLINTIPINIQKTATTTLKTIPLTTTTPKLTTKSFLNPSTVKSIYDSQNRVHVIHVSGRDRYDNLPIEQLTINNKTKITERRSSSLSNTKISKNSPKNLLKTRMEQRQRSFSSSNNKISSLEEDKESEEVEELKDLTDEYFDSAFFSPSKTSGCFGGKNYILMKIIIILILFIFNF
uniref:Uncharacterized protein n=1 Tax=Meloidogyne floridensis TaxID=298350 RepID=A0A915P9F9_9BILA